MNPDHEYLAAGLVLGGLEAEELAEAHVLHESDPEFRAEVAAVEETLGMLAESDGPVTPSAETEAAILAIPRAEGQSGPENGRAVTVPAVITPDATTAGHAAGDPAPPEPPAPGRATANRPRSTMYLALAASGMLVLAAVLGGVAVNEYQQRSDLQEQLQAAESRGDAEDLLLNAPDLSSTQAQSEDGGAVTVSYSVQEQMIRVAPEDMELPGEGQDLQMWIIDDEGAHSAGLMAAGTSMITDSAFDDGAAFGITVEPEGGSDEPTSDPIVVAEL